MTLLITITAIILVLVLLALISNRRMKAKAKEWAKEAKHFHERLQQLSDSTHDFTDKELHQLKREFAPLLDTVNKLYDSPLISNKYLDELGLGDFQEKRRLVNHRQYLSNTHQT